MLEAGIRFSTMSWRHLGRVLIPHRPLRPLYSRFTQDLHTEGGGAGKGGGAGSEDETFQTRLLKLEAELKTLRRLPEDISTIGQHIMDLVQPFIRTTAGEAVLFLVEDQPKPERVWRFPKVLRYKLDIAAHEINLVSPVSPVSLSGYHLSLKLEKCVNEQNSSVHCTSMCELRDRAKGCMLLFEHYPNLKLNLKEHFLILCEKSV